MATAATHRASRAPQDDALTPRVTAFHALPDEVLAVGLRNNRKRFFIPSSENTFAGIPFEYVMIDSGCNSILLPFPSDIASLRQFECNSFYWEIGWAAGVGNLHSPTLSIYCPETNDAVGEIHLAGRNVAPLKCLRFHLGKASAQQLLEVEALSETNKATLQTFLSDLGNRDAVERKYVLLGQSALSQLFSLQAGKLLLLCKRGYFPVRTNFRNAWRLVRNLQLPQEFHDMEDFDHDGDILAAWSDDFEDENWGEDSYLD